MWFSLENGWINEPDLDFFFLGLRGKIYLLIYKRKSIHRPRFRARLSETGGFLLAKAD